MVAELELSGMKRSSSNLTSRSRGRVTEVSGEESEYGGRNMLNPIGAYGHRQMWGSEKERKPQE